MSFRHGGWCDGKHCTAEGLEIKNLTYGYDTYNRNTSVAGTDFTQKNHYDAEGYRYALEENGKVTNFAYRGGLLVSELDTEKNLTKGYVLGNEYVGQSRVSQLNGNLAEDSYYITDEQGSIRYVLSQDGTVQNTYQYGAFGEALLIEESTSNRLRYNAQIEDDLTGLYYLRARYFNPATGRFTQEDVIYNDGLNLYAYCNSNSVMYCDPSGYEGEKLDWNQFQSMNAGKYDNAGMSDAWSLYKADNGYEHYLHRPNLRSDTVDGIVLGRGANGTFYDANTFEIIEGQVDIGHQPGKEYWRCRDAAESLGWSQSQFNDYMNHDPKNFYQFESHESNISHRYEDKSKDISSEIEAMKKYEKENGSKESKNKCTKK